MTSIDCILPLGQQLGESPVWSVEEQALYWVDSRAPTIHRLDPATGAVSEWRLFAEAQLRSMALHERFRQDAFRVVPKPKRSAWPAKSTPPAVRQWHTNAMRPKKPR